MKLAPRPLLILHADRGFQQRVGEVAAADFRDRVIGGWEALREAVAAAPPAAVVIVDPYGDDRRLSPSLRELLTDCPSTSLIAAAGRTVLGGARACGYSSDSGLRRVLQRFLGTTATGLRNGRAFETATAALLAELDLPGAEWAEPLSLAFGSEAAAELA